MFGIGRIGFEKEHNQMELTMSIRKMTKDETFSGSVNVQPGNKIVVAKFSARKSDKGERFELLCKLDFTACSQIDILELATRTCVIDLQRQWRVAANAPNSKAMTVNPFATVNVKTAIVDTTRSSGTPTQRAVSALNKLNDKERDEMLALLQKDKETRGKKTA